MRKRLNTHQMILVAILLALILACGAVYAYMFMRTEEQSTQFIPAKVDCEVEETYGNNVKSSITVTNTGNIDAYIRIRLVSYWVDKDDNVVAKPSPEISFSYNNDVWDGGADNTYYYRTAVSPGSSTPNLVPSGGLVLQTDAEGNKQVVDVFAEAIQADPITAAISAWGITIEDGKIKVPSGS